MEASQLSVRTDSGDGAAAAVVVIGGANIDVKSRMTVVPVMGTSNPGVSSTTAGGVARNIAENLGRLGVGTELITAIGADGGGAWIRSVTEASGVGMRHSVTSPAATGVYNAILDQTGDLLIAAASMSALESLTVETIDAAAAMICAAAYVVLDCNVDASVIVHAARVARHGGVPVIIDPVSVTKSARVLDVLDAGIRIHTITPNADEMHALTGSADRGPDWLRSAADQLHARGVSVVWTRCGAEGSVLSVRHDGATLFEKVPACHASLVDATGAGDAMLAGYVAALVRGFTPRDAARQGRAAAAIAIESPLTVSEQMTREHLANRTTQCDEG